MKRLKLFLATLGVMLAMAPAVSVMADTNVFKGACENSATRNSTACDSNTTSNPLVGPTGTITKVTSFISYLTGLMVVVMFIVAGFMYVTSAGDPGKVSSARDTATYAAVGIVIVVFAQGIVIFVLNRM